uniref:Intraflagellar transport protein 20 n=1 Tax=Bicosoecida sp. CB-2014 TaxID=1486930 RepID=A0A7S1CRI3_9STRA|mmetsp:Transcript_8873/g.31377  ORF Transcript_8873/g.31377 Transcript_8873/m.31377 type:complete len:130 (+) Transcript_8873:178-567(+)
MDSNVTITFDDKYRVRVLEADKFDQTRALEEACSTFVQKIEAFNATVHSLVEVLSTSAAAIEKEKLRAIGARNLSEAEPETRERRKKQIRALIAEKRAALDRLQRQYESLEKVEGEQRALIEKLSNNEA